MNIYTNPAAKSGFMFLECNLLNLKCLEVSHKTTSIHSLCRIRPDIQMMHPRKYIFSGLLEFKHFLLVVKHYPKKSSNAHSSCIFLSISLICFLMNQDSIFINHLLVPIS